MLDIRILLFSYYPTMIFTAFAGLGLLGIRMKPRTALLAGIIAGTIDYIVRLLLAPYDIKPLFDIPLMVLILAIVLKVLIRQRWSFVIGGSILSYILLVSGDYLILPLILKAIGLSIEQILANPWLSVLVGLLNGGFVILATVVSSWFKFSIVDFSRTLAK